MARGDSYQLQGQQGGIVLTATVSASGPFRWVQVVNDAVFSAFSATNLENSFPQLQDITIPAGIGIGGDITSITVDAGVVIAYYA
jgi:hypothetical protein